MRGLKSLLGILGIGLLVLVMWEFVVAPTLARRDVQHAANDVAATAAHLVFVERAQRPYDRVSADAKTAAKARAEADGTTLTAFSIDASQFVHVTINKRANTLVLQHVNRLRSWAEFNQTAIAPPR
jgi:hypothetical protein